MHNHNYWNTAGKKIRMKPGTHTYTLTSDQRPETITLDPDYWYLIKNRKRTSKPLSSDHPG